MCLIRETRSEKQSCRKTSSERGRNIDFFSGCSTKRSKCHTFLTFKSTLKWACFGTVHWIVIRSYLSLRNSSVWSSKNEARWKALANRRMKIWSKICWSKMGRVKTGGKKKRTLALEIRFLLMLFARFISAKMSSCQKARRCCSESATATSSRKVKFPDMKHAAWAVTLNRDEHQQHVTPVRKANTSRLHLLQQKSSGHWRETERHISQLSRCERAEYWTFTTRVASKTWKVCRA